MKFYVQNGGHKEIVTEEDAESAALCIVAAILTSEDLGLSPITFVSEAGYMDDMNKYGLPDMVDDTVQAFTTRSLIMTIHDVMATEQSKSLLEDIVVGMKEFEQTIPEVKEVIASIEST